MCAFYHFFIYPLTFFPQKVDKHRNDIFNYMIFLRVTPFLPNWFINIASPGNFLYFIFFLPFSFSFHTTDTSFHFKSSKWDSGPFSSELSSVRLPSFVLFFFLFPHFSNQFSSLPISGVGIPSIFYVRAGSVLQELTTTKDIIPWTTMLSLILFGFLTLIPVVFKNQFSKKLS